MRRSTEFTVPDLCRADTGELVVPASNPYMSPVRRSLGRVDNRARDKH
jgi:hypothetical protein